MILHKTKIQPTFIVLHINLKREVVFCGSKHIYHKMLMFLPLAVLEAHLKCNINL